MSPFKRRALTSGIGALAIGGGLAAFTRILGANAPAHAALSAGELDIARSAGRFVTRTGLEMLAHAVRTQPHRNAVVAPGSLVAALTMAAAATSDESRANLVAALSRTTDGETDPDDLVARIGILERALKARAEGVKITTAAALLVDKRTAPDAAFLNMLEKRLDARAQIVDFRAPQTVADLNQWISRTTDGLIPDVVSELDPDTMLALATAVTFKGRWLYGFDRAMTSDAAFRTSTGHDVRVPMMSGTETVLPYLRVDPLHAVRLPYRGLTFELVIVVPQPGVDIPLAGWIAGAGPQALAEILDPGRYTNADMQLRLPRQQIDSNIDLRAGAAASPAFAPLMSMPLRMRRLTGADLQIGQIRHKALVRMDEEGTVGAAATAVTAKLVYAQPQQIVFSVDRPHVFAIRHVATGAVVFAGYVAEPKRVAAAIG